jgi:copper chaperone CopZ
MKSIVIASIFLLFVYFLTGCGKSDNKTSETKTDNKNTQQTANDKQTLKTSADDKSVEIQCSGMTCTGCENSVKSKVKKVDGVKDVIADHKTNVVKASYDPAKTDVDKIKEAVTAAGFDVVNVK